MLIPGKSNLRRLHGDDAKSRARLELVNISKNYMMVMGLLLTTTAKSDQVSLECWMFNNEHCLGENGTQIVLYFRIFQFVQGRSLFDGVFKDALQLNKYNRN
jgi:hypothetical protein